MEQTDGFCARVQETFLWMRESMHGYDVYAYVCLYLRGYDYVAVGVCQWATVHE